MRKRKLPAVSFPITSDHKGEEKLDKKRTRARFSRRRIFQCAFLLPPSLFGATLWLFGGRYDIHGGMVGNLVDKWLHHKHERLRRQHILSFKDPYPVVTTRDRHEKVGYSPYLQEMLRLHLHKDTHRSKDMQPPKTAHDTSQSLSQRLRSTGCDPGWLCQRCLNYGQYGSVAACSSFCPHCYVREVCGVRTVWHTAGRDRMPPIRSKGIPRKVHQVFPAQLSINQYPELDRTRNGWQMSDMEYRSYDNIAEVEAYLRRFAPSIRSQFDRLPTLEFKLYAFRLLLLYKDGGIIADVDWMYSPGISKLIDSNSSLSLIFAKDPRFGEYCLSTSLLAAVPGHPLFAKILQHVLTYNATDDMDADSCYNTYLSRAFRHEYEVGACFLGQAFHRFMGRLDEDPIFLGPFHHDKGDGLVLLISDEDTGATRCTDTTQNILIASKDFHGSTIRSLEESRGLIMPRVRGRS